MAQETGTVYNSIANDTVIRATVDRPNRKITLIWDAIPGVDYYQLRRDDRILATFKICNGGYVDVVPNAGTYRYALVGFNSFGTTTPSQIVVNV